MKRRIWIPCLQGYGWGYKKKILTALAIFDNIVNNNNNNNNEEKENKKFV